MPHYILLKFGPSDVEWPERYSVLSASAKALLLAVLEARGDSFSEVTSHDLAQALDRRWTFSRDAIGLAMAELIDAECIAIVRRGRSSRRSRRAA